MKTIKSYKDFLILERIQVTDKFIHILNDIIMINQDDIIEDYLLDLKDIIESGDDEDVFKKDVFFDIVKNGFMDLNTKNTYKFGKAILKLLPDISNMELEKIIQLFRYGIKSNDENLNDNNNANDKFKIYNDKFDYWYKAKSVLDQGRYDSLSGSCMLDKPKHHFDLYNLNDNIKLLALLDNDTGKLKARAILWDTENHGIVMDKIYSDTKEDFYKLQKYAFDKGWNMRKNSDKDDITIIDNKGNIINDKINIKILNVPEEFPFLDTFKIFDQQSSILSNKHDNIEDIDLEKGVIYLF